MTDGWSLPCARTEASLNLPASPRHRSTPFGVWAAAALLLAAASLTACSTQVHVTIETTVSPDGAVTRRVSFLRARGSSLKEDYRLPEGPGWKVKEERVSQEALTPEERRAVVVTAETFLRYTAKRTYPPGHTVEPDYVKPHQSVSGRAASNAVTLERAPGFLGLGTTYSYRETFTDVSEPEALEKLLREALRLEVSSQVEALRAAHPEAAPWGAVEAKELEEVEVRLEYVLASWRSVTDEASRQAAKDAFERSLGWWVEFPERLAAVAGLEVEAVNKLLEDPEEGKREKEFSQAMDRYLGAYPGAFVSFLGDTIFTFTVIVHMPGAIFLNNAEELRGRSTAVCRFAAEYFFSRPFTCEAKSWSPAGF